MGVLKDRLSHAWDAFLNVDKITRATPSYGHGSVYSARPDRVRMALNNERTILASVLTRMSIDAAAVQIRHVQLDDNERYKHDFDSQLNECLKVAPNLDQAPTQFRQELFLTLFDAGVAAIMPVETTLNPNQTSSFDIKQMRVARIVDWAPNHVQLDAYNQNSGSRERVWMEKKNVTIVENPLYLVMNEPNSTLQRLIRKLSMKDSADEVVSSNKLDLIIQLPYVIKSETRRNQAEQRRQDLELQLKNSQHGIAYTDATEKVVQLNRSVENNLLQEIEYLTKLLYTQLGVTEEVMNGTADEATMLNYNNRTIVPLVTAVVEAMRRAFLTKTGRTQGQSINFFSEPFKLVPIANIADIADKFARNEVLSSNEIRQIIGFKPSDDPDADKLKNSNMPEEKPAAIEAPKPLDEGDNQNGSS